MFLVYYHTAFGDHHAAYNAAYNHISHISLGYHLQCFHSFYYISLNSPVKHALCWRYMYIYVHLWMPSRSFSIAIPLFSSFILRNILHWSSLDRFSHWSSLDRFSHWSSLDRFSQLSVQSHTIFFFLSYFISIPFLPTFLSLGLLITVDGTQVYYMLYIYYIWLHIQYCLFLLFFLPALLAYTHAHLPGYGCFCFADEDSYNVFVASFLFYLACTHAAFIKLGRQYLHVLLYSLFNAYLFLYPSPVVLFVWIFLHGFHININHRFTASTFAWFLKFSHVQPWSSSSLLLHIFGLFIPRALLRFVVIDPILRSLQRLRIFSFYIAYQLTLIPTCSSAFYHYSIAIVDPSVDQYTSAFYRCSIAIMVHDLSIIFLYVTLFICYYYYYLCSPACIWLYPTPPAFDCIRVILSFQ